MYVDTNLCVCLCLGRWLLVHTCTYIHMLWSYAHILCVYTHVSEVYTHTGLIYVYIHIGLCFAQTEQNDTQRRLCHLFLQPPSSHAVCVSVCVSVCICVCVCAHVCVCVHTFPHIYKKVMLHAYLSLIQQKTELRKGYYRSYFGAARRCVWVCVVCACGMWKGLCM